MQKIKKNDYYRRWLAQGTMGVLLTGAGACMMIEAGFYKHSDPGIWYWIAAGTGSLIVLVAGLTLFVDSIRYRMYYELEQDRVHKTRDKS